MPSLSKKNDLPSFSNKNQFWTKLVSILGNPYVTIEGHTTSQQQGYTPVPAPGNPCYP